jgi:Family of unknown function (DUF6152)
MGTRFLAIAFLFSAFLMSPLPALAHHGNASYDTSRLITIEGKVTQFMWANPHVFLRVDVTNQAGETEHWVIEGQNAPTQAGNGWTRDMFKPGDTVAIEATPAKNGRLIARFERRGRIFINGKEFKQNGMG